MLRTHNALLIEDDPQDRANLKANLESMGLVVFDADTAEAAFGLFETDRFSIVLIHLGKTPWASLEVCKQFRARSTVPIIMLTKRDEVIDEQMVLSAGADDYLTKPISARILTLRITQHIQRDQQPVQERVERLTWGPLTLDIAQHSFSISDTYVSLTRSEFLFLQLLMQNPNGIFSRGEILEAMGAFVGVKSNHLVDTHASRLRKKIRENGGPEVVASVRSVGFRLAAK
jgi:DNA-binding response OmpR family regulator